MEDNVRRRTDVVWRVAPGFLALSREGRDVTAVHGPAADVWELLAEPTSGDHIATTLAARYAAPTEVVRRDIEALLALLGEQGYLVDEPTDSGSDGTP
jgi:hypothetical protein